MVLIFPSSLSSHSDSSHLFSPSLTRLAKLAEPDEEKTRFERRSDSQEHSKEGKKKKEKRRRMIAGSKKINYRHITNYSSVNLRWEMEMVNEYFFFFTNFSPSNFTSTRSLLVFVFVLPLTPSDL